MRDEERTESNSTIESAGRIHHVEVRLSVVRLSRLVDFGLRQEEQGRTVRVPLHLNSIGFVERFRGDSRGECGERMNLD